jgi:hypothetical protein
MSANGQLRETTADAHVLRWPGRLLVAEDLRRALNGHREVVLSPQAIITPLAAEELRSNGVQVRRQALEERPVAQSRWGVAQDRPYPQIGSALQTLEREGTPLKDLCAGSDGLPCQWAKALAECVARGECQGGVLFCHDPGLVCCVANKLAGLRAVPVVTVAQAARATLMLGANLIAVEMPGRTFFEVRQILRTVCLAPGVVCPPGVACTLQELDGHAHR